MNNPGYRILHSKIIIFVVLLTFLASPNFAASAPKAPDDLPTWQSECITCPLSIGIQQHAIQLAPDGTPTVAFGGDFVHLARYVSGTWQIETVDNTPGSGAPVLAFDQSGFPHLAYAITRLSSLRYAYKDAAGWHFETIHVDYDIQSGRDMLLTPDGSPRIVFSASSYSSSSGRHLMLASRISGNWNVETVDPTDNVGNGCSIAQDSSGYLHISYEAGYPNYALRYAYQDATGWHVETQEDGFTIRYTSIVIDAQNEPHITYQYDWGDLKHSWKDTSGWHNEMVDPSLNEDVGEENSLRIDGQGYLHVSYYDSTLFDLKYAYQDSGGWHIGVVDATSDSGALSSLALDTTGHPRIVYHSDQNLKFAAWNGAAWSFQLITPGGWPGMTNALVLDNSGTPHVLYQDFNKLTYAYRTDTGWHTELAALPEEWYWINNPTLAVDSTGTVKGAYFYYDWVPDLMYLYRDGAGWHAQSVDGGEYWEEVRVAIALDDQDYPHLAYSVDDESLVKYAFQDGTGWHLQTIDSNPGYYDPWIYPSIQLDAADHPHILYNDYQSGILEYHWFDGSNWRAEPISLNGDLAREVDMKLNANGYPLAAYYDSVDMDLRFVYKDASGWHFQTVDSQGDVGQKPSLALDLQGNIHISYIDQTNNRLKYALFSNGAWEVGVVDPDSVGSQDIAIDTAGRPHIVYQDDQLGDLLYADGTYTPKLMIDHDSGQPGSYFNLTGINYTPGITTTLTVNGVLLDQFIIGSSGTFTATLDTNLADLGDYRVSASYNPSASTSFTLASDAPLWPLSGNATIYEVPAGIAMASERLHLPLVLR